MLEHNKDSWPFLRALVVTLWLLHLSVVFCCTGLIVKGPTKRSCSLTASVTLQVGSRLVHENPCFSLFFFPFYSFYFTCLRSRLFKIPRLRTKPLPESDCSNLSGINSIKKLRNWVIFAIEDCACEVRLEKNWIRQTTSEYKLEVCNRNL